MNTVRTQHYRNGQIMSVRTYNDKSQMNGRITGWYPTSEFTYDFFYIKNKIEGEKFSYHDDYDMKYGTGKAIEFESYIIK